MNNPSEFAAYGIIEKQLTSGHRITVNYTNTLWLSWILPDSQTGVKDVTFSQIKIHPLLEGTESDNSPALSSPSLSVHWARLPSDYNNRHLGATWDLGQPELHTAIVDRYCDYIIEGVVQQRTNSEIKAYPFSTVLLRDYKLYNPNELDKLSNWDIGPRTIFIQEGNDMVTMKDTVWSPEHGRLIYVVYEGKLDTNGTNARFIEDVSARQAYHNKTVNEEYKLVGKQYKRIREKVRIDVDPSFFPYTAPPET